MFTITNLGAGFLTTIKDALMNNFGPSVALIGGAVALIFGIVQIVRGIISEQQRGSRLTWGVVAFAIGGFLMTGSALTFFKTQGTGSASDLGLK